jgi:hypothetical protein
MSTVKGVLKNKHGQCCRAMDNGLYKGHVQTFTCDARELSQRWVYDAGLGQIRSAAGHCLSSGNWRTELSDAIVVACDPGNWSQRWSYDEVTGIIRGWRGLCLDAGEPHRQGGQMYTRRCSVTRKNLQWIIGGAAAFSTQQDDAALLANSGAALPCSLLCFALMVPGTYEEQLLSMQYMERASLFGCDEYAVYSNKKVAISDNLTTGIVDSDLKCGKGGEFGTVLNLEIFIAVWNKVIADSRFQYHEWTVKVDPDAVFMPHRLREILKDHPDVAGTGVYLNNCKFGLHGPLEVFSRNAVRAWASGKDHCVAFFQQECDGDCLWGEDMFIDQCLQRVLNVHRENDYRLLLEDHCEPPPRWKDCSCSSCAAFHPFKDAQSYFQCYHKSVGRTTESAAPTVEPAQLATGVTASLVPVPTPAPTEAPTPGASAEATQPPAAAALASGAISGSGSSECPLGCHTCVRGDACWEAVDWATRVGIEKHQDWYPGVTPDSSPEEIQEVLHGTDDARVPMPCRPCSHDAVAGITAA